MRNRIAGVDDIEAAAVEIEETEEAKWDKLKNKKTFRAYYLMFKTYICTYMTDTKPSNDVVSTRDHSSFRVIGVEIGWMSPFFQYVYCASGVMIFLVLYGILQEHVVMNKFKRSLGVSIS